MNIINKINILVIFLGLVIITIFSSLFTLDQRYNAIIFQFGEAVSVIKEPGLHFKIPLIQNVRFLDKRILNVNAQEKEVTASDEKRIIVDAFAKYRITDPVQFIKTVGSYDGANLRLNKLLESSIRTVIGMVPLNSLLTDERPKLMKKIRNLVHNESQAFGLEVIDVRILKGDLPEENSAAIYSRMQTDREKEAKQIRAEGAEEAAKIRSRADKNRKIILARAYKTSQEIKSLGDKKAAKIYNDAYSQDHEFYKLYGFLKTYKTSLKAENTKYILPPNSNFLKMLELSKID